MKVDLSDESIAADLAACMAAKKELYKFMADRGLNTHQAMRTFTLCVFDLVPDAKTLDVFLSTIRELYAAIQEMERRGGKT